MSISDGLSGLARVGWSTSHRTRVLFVLLPSGQVCPVEETNHVQQRHLEEGKVKPFVTKYA